MNWIATAFGCILNKVKYNQKYNLMVEEKPWKRALQFYIVAIEMYFVQILA